MRLTVTRDDLARGLVEERVGAVVDALPLPPGTRHGVLVSVLEAVTNAIEHGTAPDAPTAGGPEGGTAKVEIEVTADRFVATVTDRGPGFDPAGCPDPRDPGRLLLPSGRGLLLMRHLMDSVDYAFPPDGGTTVTLRKAIPTAHPAGANPSPAEGEPPMAVTQRVSGGVTVLDVGGRITIGTGDVELREAVARALDDGAGKIVLNLEKVTTIDSSGIGELVSAYTRATDRGAKLALSNVPPKVLDVLHITQLITVFEVYDEESEAVAAL